MKKIIQPIFLAFCLFSCSIFTEKSNIPYQTGIQLTLDSLVMENEIPGLNFSIIYPDGRQENYSSGFSDLNKKIPLNSGHVLFSGSIGKTYAVAVLMQLVEEGKLKLHDRFIDYFPDTLWLNDLPNIEEITIEMLLTHTSGLPRYVMQEGFWDVVLANPDKVWMYRDRIIWIAGKKAQHPAGEGWAYSDSNYILLGMLIEFLTGNDYYDEVDARLLKPYALNDTYPSLKRNMQNLSMGYSSLTDWGMPEEVVIDGIFLFNPQMEWTGGGFACTTPDLASWAKIYYDGGVISDTLLRKMTTPCKNGEELGDNTAYGMGTFIYSTGFGQAWGHTGTMPGYNSIFGWYPDYKIAVALQANCDYAGSKMGLVKYLDRIITNIFPESSYSNIEK